MATGPLAPCPIRLGGTRENGWPVADHARAALDISAAQNLLPLGVLTVHIDASGTTTLLSSLSRAGANVLAFWAQTGVLGADVLTVGSLLGNMKYPGSNEYIKHRLTWATFYIGGTALGTNIEARAVGEYLSATIPSYPTYVQVEIWGDVYQTDPHEYGTDEGKIASKTEGDIPYAYWQLQELIKDQGSAFSTEPGSKVMIENLVEARLWGLGYRLAERHAANQTPATAGQAIYRWAKILGVQRGLDAEWQLRKRCVNKMRFRSSGSTQVRLEEALISVLGDSFVGLTFHDGTFDSPPVPTYWPGVNEGAPLLDLGGGTWTSDRARVTLSLQSVAGKSDQVVANLANGEILGLLRDVLPATNTWDWSFDTASGFVLGTSILGWNSL
jgi:hypothetical protein